MDRWNSKEKTFLLLGGDASLAQAFGDLARRQGFRVLVTSRRRGTVISDDVFALDISSMKSIDIFLSEISKAEVSAVYCFLGAPYKGFISFEEYISVHLVNTFYLLEQLVARFKILETEALFYVSSRAARFPSRDAPYAIAKGGLTAGVQALSKQAPPGTVVASILPGLILESSMSKDMGEELTEEHMLRSGGRLLNVHGFADELLELFNGLTPDQNGAIITIGPEYK